MAKHEFRLTIDPLHDPQVDTAIHCAATLLNNHRVHNLRPCRPVRCTMTMTEVTDLTTKVGMLAGIGASCRLDASPVTSGFERMAAPEH